MPRVSINSKYEIRFSTVQWLNEFYSLTNRRGDKSWHEWDIHLELGKWHSGQEHDGSRGRHQLHEIVERWPIGDRIERLHDQNMEFKHVQHWSNDQCGSLQHRSVGKRHSCGYRERHHSILELDGRSLFERTQEPLPSHARQVPGQ